VTATEWSTEKRFLKREIIYIFNTVNLCTLVAIFCALLIAKICAVVIAIYTNHYAQVQKLIILNIIDTILRKKEINTGRQIELDIAKGLAIVFMIFDHVLEEYGSAQLSNTIFADIVYFLARVPAAPVFMFSMGAGFLYSRNRNNYQHFLQRGFRVFLFGYILNILRGTCPLLAGFLIWGEYDRVSLIEWTLEIDILQFAGLAMIFWGLLVKFQIQEKKYLLISIILVLGLLNFILAPVETDSMIISSLSGLLWGSCQISYFPFLTWIFYPIIGYLFANILIRCANKNKLYLRLVCVSVLIFVLLALSYSRLGINYGTDYDVSYFHHTFLVNIIYGVAIIAWMGMLYFVGKYFPKILKNIFQRWSKNIALMYLIHWILIGWIDLFMPDNGILLWGYLTISLTIFVMSDFLAYRLSKRGVKIF